MLHDWFNANKLTLNVSKTVGMLFSPNKKQYDLKIEIDSTRIPMVESNKFLETWVDRHLNWKTHIDKLALQINSRNGLLKGRQRIISSNAMKVLYYAQIHSIIQYGIVVWGNMANKTQIKRLQKLQSISVRQIDRQKHTGKVYQKYKIPKIDQLIALENVKLWHKQQTNQLPSRLQTIMTEDHTYSTLNRGHKYPTRNKKVPKLLLAKSPQYQNSLFIKGLTKYQKLPLELRKINNCNQFNSKAKEFIIS